MQVVTDSQLKQVIINTALAGSLTEADFEFFDWLLWALELNEA